MHVRFRSLRHAAAAALLCLPVVAACATDTGSSPESTGSASSALFTNGDFETGTTGQVPPAPWTLSTFLNPGVTVQTPQTRAGLNLGAGGTAFTTTIAQSNAAQVDLGGGASLRVCRYGAKCAQINFHGNNQNVNSLTQQMTIAQGDVDTNDNLVHVRFAVAPVLQNPGHTATQQPYYFVQLTNDTTNTILYSDFNLSAQQGVPWKCVNCGTGTEIDYVDWALVDIAPGNAKLKVGDKVTLELMASGCSLGGHWGELYADGVGASVPGLYVSGAGPAQANAGANITYTLTYKNGGSQNATSVVTDFTTPPNTTYQSIVAPNGANCTTPAVNATGTVVCTFANAIAPGASGTYQVTVNINNNATGTIVAGNYDIKSAQESALLGPKVTTLIGCAADVDCLAGNWCNISAKACTPTLPNGTLMPTDNGHVTPVLNAKCSVNAGALVCTSKVCDTSDDKCGLADGTGPCTVQNGGTVCRSGSCSQTGVCKQANQCLVDADCTAGNWCNISTKTCTPTLANGAAMPTDNGHVNPVLNAKCTVAASALVCKSSVCDTTDDACGYLNGSGPCSQQNGATVCRSAVCDPDLKCGYAVGSGPCTKQNEGTVCRSGSCSVNGTCQPNGGCNVDADCKAGNWCNESVHTCTPTLSNGTAMPTDGPHQNPTLNGKCTVAAGLLVCSATVCDASDDKCGYVDGSGPCTQQNGGTVCRSGACSQNGTCMPKNGCNVDADCTAGNWCDMTKHACTPTLSNGTPMPTDGAHVTPTLNGKCTVAAATLVCTATVCETSDDKCGLLNGNGPCDSNNGSKVCRSAVCDPDLKCGYANGSGPCTAQDASTVCRSTHCATTGPNLGKCAECDTDVDCPNTAPACDPKTNKCGECSATNASQCKGNTPLCDTATDKCVGCDGDFGDAKAKHACDKATPFCASTGSCGKCSSNADCAGHPAGPICDTASGACTTQCKSDADCDTTSQWCNGEKGATGACVPKLPNGTPLPASPSDVAHCTSGVGKRVCKTGACDPATDKCGAPEPGADGGVVPGTDGGAASSTYTLEGGGCSCDVGRERDASGTAAFGATGLALAMVVRRRRRR